MTPQELAEALDAMPEADVLSTFSSVMQRRNVAGAPTAPEPMPELSEEDLIYIALFVPMPAIPLAGEDAEIYDRLFKAEGDPA